MISVRLVWASIVILAIPAAPATAQPGDDGSWSYLTVEDGLPAPEVRAILASSDGGVWLGFRDHGLARLRGEAIEVLTTADGLVSNGIADLHEDVYGRLWAAGFLGFSVDKGGSWNARTSFGSVEPRVVFAVHEDIASRSVWLAGSGGAGRLREGEWSTFGPDDGLPHAVVHDVEVDGDGAVWFACRRGLARMKDGKVVVFRPDLNFRSIVEGGDGRLWFGTSDGVYEFDGSTWRHHLSGRTVSPVATGEAGEIWASSEGEGAFRYAEGEWRRLTMADGLPSDVVYDIDRGPDGALWFATDAGAARYMPGPPPSRPVNQGNHEFHPVGAPAVRIRFDVTEGRARGLEILDGTATHRATRQR